MQRWHSSVEARTVANNTTAATDGGGFADLPQHLGELAADAIRAKAALWNAIGTRPLPAVGMSVRTPAISVGPTVAEQAEELDEISSTAIIEAVVEADVQTLAGTVDVSVQLLERAEPNFDVVVARGLGAALGEAAETLLISTLRAVAGNIDIAYSDPARPPRRCGLGSRPRSHRCTRS